MEAQALNELNTVLIAGGTTLVIFLARMASKFINTLPGWQKMLMSLVLPYVLNGVGGIFGVEISNIESLTDPAVASPLVAGALSMGIWAGSKELMKAMKRYGVNEKGKLSINKGVS